jgi:sodium/bile acid cotransporter 7
MQGFVRLLARLDRYILALVGTVALASILPARGAWAVIASIVTDTAIVLLFFLHGARLSRKGVMDGAGNWRLHLTVAAMSFVLFPLLGIGITEIPSLNPLIATGMLFVTILPSTIQSSIAFTATARGDVAAAVCGASFSNLAGMVLTPALAALLIGGHGTGSTNSGLMTIVLQLLFPFLAGHLLRPWIGDWVSRRKRLVTAVDRGSILLVVYTAVGAAVVGGLWQRVSAVDFAIIAALSSALLAVVMTSSWWIGSTLKFGRAERIVLLFCGSKKSLASGVPMAGALFAPAQVGAMVIPLILFHQLQLIVSAYLARGLADERIDPQLQGFLRAEEAA